MNYDRHFLEHVAYTTRVDILRATTEAGSGHPTSSFSSVEIVVALFFVCMHKHDEFILSKGHAVPVLYAVFKACGIITDDDLMSLRKFDFVFEGHPTPRTPGIHFATGSLGQGLSIGLGVALAHRFKNFDAHTYVLLGDSELTEGSNWEAFALASHYNLSRLIAIVDCNALGQTTTTLEGHDVQRIAQKISSFGWNTLICDGHNFDELSATLSKARINTEKPTTIIAMTQKGFGLPIAGKQGYHGKAFSKEELPELLDYIKQQFPQAASYSESDVRYCSSLMHVRNTLQKKVSHDTERAEACARSLLTHLPEKPMATRYAYGMALALLGKQELNLVVLDAEVKNSTYAELFEKEFPEKFVQCFVAEQNMIGMAVGFAAEGFVPFASTFAAFMTRAYDQIRMAAIGRASLRLCGSHAGVSIGEDGPSQMGLEDIALMRAVPDSVVLYPCDVASTIACVQLMARYNAGISYLRTTRSATQCIYSLDEKFMIGGCKVLRSSTYDSVCIVAAGITVFEALQAYDELAKQNIFVRIIDCYSIKPLPLDELKKYAQECNNNVITVEDHYRAGGLGEACAAALSTEKISVYSLAVDKLPRSGKPAQLRAYEAIDMNAIISMVKKIVV